MKATILSLLLLAARLFSCIAVNAQQLDKVIARAPQPPPEITSMNRWLSDSSGGKAGQEKLLKSSLQSFVIATMFFGATALSEAPAETKENVGPACDIEMCRMIPVRDGVELEAWIFKPSHLKAQSPTVLELTQYAIDAGSHHESDDLVRRGYSRGFPSASTQRKYA